MSINKDFLSRFLIGRRLSCQPLRCHVKILDSLNIWHDKNNDYDNNNNDNNNNANDNYDNYNDNVYISIFPKIFQLSYHNAYYLIFGHSS